MHPQAIPGRFPTLLGSKLEWEFLAQESDALESRRLGLGGCTTFLMGPNSTAGMRQYWQLYLHVFFLSVFIDDLERKRGKH